MSSLPTLALAPLNLPHTTALPPEIRAGVSVVRRDADGRFHWTVSVEAEGDNVATVRYCRTNQHGDGLEIHWGGDAWWGWLRPDQFSLAGIHEFHQMDHALEGYLSVDTAF